MSAVARASNTILKVVSFTICLRSNQSISRTLEADLVFAAPTSQEPSQSAAPSPYVCLGSEAEMLRLGQCRPLCLQ
jgi:hypothetical protein